jgi:hypothetical protein
MEGEPACDRVSLICPAIIWAEKELGRLRLAIRVNGLRWGATDEQIDALLYPEAIPDRSEQTNIPPKP